MERGGLNQNAHPDCINASNPFHTCSDYCYRKIAERKSLLSSAPTGKTTRHDDSALSTLPSSFGRPQTKRRREDGDDVRSTVTAGAISKASAAAASVTLLERAGEGVAAEESAGGQKGEAGREDGEGEQEEEEPALPADYGSMSERQKKLFDLRLKLNQARKANQTAVVDERKKKEQPERESRGMSKAAWLEEKKKKMGKVLEANGLDMTKAYLLETVEEAEAKYKKWEKQPAAFGWDVFNQRSLYKAYKKRAADIPVSMEEYNKAKESDPDFYRDASSLQYGKVPDIPEENVDRMVEELEGRGGKRKEFSRRRRVHEERDVDSINERNEHFNRKIERAFGKYTVEIKNNLERGTALPD